MSDLERVDSWREQAGRVFDAANDPAIDAAAREREDVTISQRAVADVYTEWYNAELLPIHEETWQLAVRSLASYGHPLRSEGMGYTKYGLSTGVLGVDNPQHVGERGMDTVATGLRLSVLSNEALTTGARRTIAKSQEDPHDQSRLRRAVKVVDELARHDTISVEAISVATNRERLSFMTRETVREVAYPRTLRQRVHNFWDEKSKELVREAMKTPDLDAHYTPLKVFRLPQSGWDKTKTYTDNEMRLRPPALFTPDDLKYKKGSEGLEEAQQAGQREIACIATLGSMLIAVDRPLREMAAFQPRVV